jgi:mRNA interferase RelE/StbE
MPKKKENPGLLVPDEVAELVRRLHPQLKAGIKTALRDILDNPACGKALKDELDGLRSYRFKRFRIIYRIATGGIDIVAIGPRRYIYKETFLIISRENPE